MTPSEHHQWLAVMLAFFALAVVAGLNGMDAPVEARCEEAHR